MSDFIRETALRWCDRIGVEDPPAVFVDYLEGLLDVRPLDEALGHVDRDHYLRWCEYESAEAGGELAHEVEVGL